MRSLATGGREEVQAIEISSSEMAMRIEIFPLPLTTCSRELSADVDWGRDIQGNEGFQDTRNRGNERTQERSLTQMSAPFLKRMMGPSRLCFMCPFTGNKKTLSQVTG